MSDLWCYEQEALGHPCEALSEAQGIVDGLLRIVNARKGDDWGDACCIDCRDNPWHGEGRYGDVSIDARDESTEAVPRCDCICHDARRHLGGYDAENDPVAQRPRQDSNLQPPG